eukprot:287630-Lingulodinium_polyedra.AAC.1
MDEGMPRRPPLAAQLQPALPARPAPLTRRHDVVRVEVEGRGAEGDRDRPGQHRGRQLLELTVALGEVARQLRGCRPFGRDGVGDRVAEEVRPANGALQQVLRPRMGLHLSHAEGVQADGA